MRVLAIGKYPPMQGGVSTQMYDLVTGLAARGHVVSLVTDACEVEAESRIYMKADDWRQSIGRKTLESLSVKWVRGHAEPALGKTQKQKLIPFINDALAIAEEFDPDIVFSFYLEPYAIVGDSISTRLNVPHVLRTAGSDVDRVQRFPALAKRMFPIFDRATAIWTSRNFASYLERQGIPSDRLILSSGTGTSPGRFLARAGTLDIKRLQKEISKDGIESCRGIFRKDLRYVGLYGKLEPTKGFESLLAALSVLTSSRSRVGAVIMGGGSAAQIADLLRKIESYGLTDHVVRIPFLPPWRVPEFLASVDVVCCLEQGFHIKGHNPALAREAMSAGKVLIASEEVLRKMPYPERLISGFNCIEVTDVNATDQLAKAIAFGTQYQQCRRNIEKRARRYAEACLFGKEDVSVLERILFRSLNVTSALRHQTAERARSFSVSTNSAIRHESSAIEKECGGHHRKTTWSEEGHDDQWNKEISIVSHALSDLRQAQSDATERCPHEKISKLPEELAGRSDRLIAKSGALHHFGVENLKLLNLHHDAGALLDSLQSGVTNRYLPEPVRGRRDLLIRSTDAGLPSAFYLIDRRYVPGIRTFLRKRRRKNLGASGLRLLELGLLRLTHPDAKMAHRKRAELGI